MSLNQLADMCKIIITKVRLETSKTNSTRKVVVTTEKSIKNIDQNDRQLHKESMNWLSPYNSQHKPETTMV